MVGRVRAAYDRLGPWPVFAGFAGVGAAAWGVAILSLAPLVRAFGSGAPVLTLAPHDAVGLPIGVTFLAFAAITLSSPSDPKPRTRGQRGRTTDWPAWCLAVAAAGVALSFLAGAIATLAVGAAAGRRGYVACPAIVGERPARQRWVRADLGPAHCPPSPALAG